jgi:DNA-3-methyladenine glycosylase II
MRKDSFATFESQRDLATAVGKLNKQCVVMRAVHARTGTPALRTFEPNFAGLARIITGQQLSAQSAAAIWSRVAESIVPFEAERVMQLGELKLGEAGLSRPKIKTLKLLAAAVETDGLDFEDLNRCADDAVIARLTALHGIGRWSAEIYLLFALRRADTFPAGDLALQLAAQRAFGLSEKPLQGDLIALAERWRPWRGAAAHLLWADYASNRGKPQKNPEKNPAVD